MKIVLILILLIFGHAVKASDSSGIKHIVLCWLNEPENDEITNEVMRTSRELADIPFVDDVIVGTVVPSDRNIVDDTFHIGAVMSFKNEDNLNKYLVHDEHVKRVKQVLAPNCNRILIYDIQY